jgi:hypothetical protein
MYAQITHLKRLLTIYGFRINPDTLWKVTPWSWFIDWFFALGRNIKIMNAIAEDSVAAKYAYIMSHQVKTTNQISISFFKSGNLAIVVPRHVEYKQRVNAGSPYGFSRGWETLSPKQLGILGALGVTKTSWR